MSRNPFDKSASDMTASPSRQAEEPNGADTPQVPGSNPYELLTRRRVADEYGIRVKVLERYAWAGGGPKMVKLGRRTVRYRRGDIEAFIDAHVVDGQG